MYAITNIPAGAEINISYLPLITSTAVERSAALREHFGFAKCMCQLCSSPPDVVAASDRRRTEIKELVEGVRVGRGADRGAVMAAFERIAGLVEEEGYPGLPEFGTSRGLLDSCLGRCRLR